MSSPTRREIQPGTAGRAAGSVKTAHISFYHRKSSLRWSGLLSEFLWDDCIELCVRARFPGAPGEAEPPRTGLCPWGEGTGLCRWGRLSGAETVSKSKRALAPADFAPEPVLHTKRKESGETSPLSFSFHYSKPTASALPSAPSHRADAPSDALPTWRQDEADGPNGPEPKHTARRPSGGSRKSTRSRGPAVGGGAQREGPAVQRGPQPAQTKLQAPGKGQEAMPSVFFSWEFCPPGICRFPEPQGSGVLVVRTPIPLKELSAYNKNALKSGSIARRKQPAPRTFTRPTPQFSGNTFPIRRICAPTPASFSSIRS